MARWVIFPLGLIPNFHRCRFVMGESIVDVAELVGHEIAFRILVRPLPGFSMAPSVPFSPGVRIISAPNGLPASCGAPHSSIRTWLPIGDTCAA